MFTGIIETTGDVWDIREISAGRRIVLDVSRLSELPDAGASLCVDGVCLTVVNPTTGRCEFDVIRETLRRTTLGELQVGRPVNLERSVQAGGRFDGHFVQGHIDAVTTVDSVITGSNEQIIWLNHSDQIGPCIVPKGSVAVNGVSLTIASVEPARFSVALIPTTLDRTNLGSLTAGRRVNIETDILARTVFHQLAALGITGGKHGRP